VLSSSSRTRNLQSAVDVMTWVQKDDEHPVTSLADHADVREDLFSDIFSYAPNVGVLI
jgi:hypothetical protein